jgi:hypothetical protein
MNNPFDNGSGLTFPPGGLSISPPWGYGGPGGVVRRPPNLAPPGTPPIARVLSLPLPEDSPIPDAREFNKTGSVATAAVMAAPALVTGCTFVIPAATLGVVRTVSIYITNMIAATNVQWWVMVDGGAASGYDPVTIFPRVASSISNSFDSKIRVKGPATVSVVFQNFDGGAYQVGASIGGWYWPEASDERWKSFGA